MDRKINVFIGGSSESLDEARTLKESLESFGSVNCTIWNNGIFVFNKNFLDSLTHASYSFDFGILIATNDDIALMRNSLKDIPRDNVIFEYGLFLGSMGNSKTFLLQEKGVNLPSDLLGYTTPRFESNFTSDQWLELSRELHDKLLEEHSKSNIQVLPSTSLAIGYFDSFLKKICHYVMEKEGPLLNKNQFNHSKIIIQIIIPEELSSDIGAKAKIYFQNRNFIADEIGVGGRPFPIRFFRKKDDLTILDIPTTLNAIRPSVDLLVSTNSIGPNNMKNQIERKELENFKRTLEYLISQDDYSNCLVEVLWESQVV